MIGSVWGEIDERASGNVTAQLMEAAYEGAPEITLLICSQGGQADDSRAVIAAMELAKGAGVTVRTIGLGTVCSAAVDILCAGSPGFRAVHEQCILMLHGTSADIRNHKEWTLVRALDEQTLSRYTKLRKNQRERMLEQGDWYFGPDEAVQWGVVDAVIKSGDKTGPWLTELKNEQEKRKAEKAAGFAGQPRNDGTDGCGDATHRAETRRGF